MSRIVKSIAVVEREERIAETPPPLFQLADARIIKGGLLDGQAPAPVSTSVFSIAPKDTYLDELNRIKAEIELARTELRTLRGELEAEPEEQAVVEEAEAEEADTSLADEAVYLARQQEINSMLQAAEEEIAAMNKRAEEEAKHQLDQSRNEGYLEGFQKGYDEAVAEFKKENDPKGDALADLVERLSGWEQQRLKDNEAELVELVLAVARKVIGSELHTDPACVVRMLTEAVAKNSREESIRINLAENLLPVDVKASEEVAKKLRETGADVTVRTSPGLPDDTIHLETPSGTVDMSVDTQLVNIRSVLIED